jgi:hypothetical protein
MGNRGKNSCISGGVRKIVHADPTRYEHERLNGRDSNDQHPISAITDLEDKLEDIDNTLEEILNPSTLSGLTFDGVKSIYEVGELVDNPLFRWSENGTVVNKVISDDKGLLNENVNEDDDFYQSSVSYQPMTTDSVSWTITADNNLNASLTKLWVHASFNGKNTTGILPTESEILNGAKKLTTSWNDFTVNPLTDGNEYAWFAVDKLQTNKLYTQWFIAVDNYGTISDGNLVKYGGEVTVSGRVYDVYIFSFSSEVKQNIKLS